MLKKEENKNTNNFRANPARVINWLRVWDIERSRRRRSSAEESTSKNCQCLSLVEL